MIEPYEYKDPDIIQKKMPTVIAKLSIEQALDSLNKLYIEATLPYIVHLWYRIENLENDLKEALSEVKKDLV